MAMITAWPQIDDERIVEALHKAGELLEGTEGEVVLDFSLLRRVDPSGLRAMEELVRIADEKAVKIVLRGVNVDVYKVLKLVKVASRFAFVN